MERIKVNITGSATIPNDRWEEGYDFADTILWAKQNDSINMKISTDTCLHVPVARPIVVKALDGVVQVDDNLVQFDDKNCMKELLGIGIGDNVITVQQAANTTPSLLAQLNGKDITSFDAFKYFTKVTEIGMVHNSAMISFGQCAKLKHLTLPDSLTHVENSYYESVWGAIEELDYNNINYCSSMLPYTCKQVTIRTACNFNNPVLMSSNHIIEKIFIKDIETFLKCQYGNAEGIGYGGKSPFSRAGEASLYLIDDPDTKLTSLTIPFSITQINAYALYNLKTIIALSYEGSVSEWLAIPKGELWHTNVPVEYIQCTDGKVGLDDTVETGNTYTE